MSCGGVAIQALTDFAIQGNIAYSFDRIAQFSLRKILEVNRIREAEGMDTKSPGRVISDFIKKHILD